jgi:hypothetical protein
VTDAEPCQRLTDLRRLRLGNLAPAFGVRK